jgi:hypothetical protein
MFTRVVRMEVSFTILFSIFFKTTVVEHTCGHTLYKGVMSFDVPKLVCVVGQFSQGIQERECLHGQFLLLQRSVGKPIDGCANKNAAWDTGWTSGLYLS